MRRVLAPAALCGWLLLQGCGGGEPAAPAADGADGQAAGSALNSPPVIQSVALVPSRPRPGETVQANVVANDPDGDPITLEYHWRVAGQSVDAPPDRSSLHVESHGRESAIEVTVVAHDAQGASSPETAVAHVGNLPPTIVQVVLQPSGKVSAGTDITASTRASDPEGSELEYHYHWTVNGRTAPVEGPTLPGNQFQRGDTIALEVVASDGEEDSEPVQSPPIPVVNAPPRITSQPGQIGADGIFRYNVVAEDPDGDKSFRYRLNEGPPGMSIGFDDGKLKWEPPADVAGSHPVEIEVEDLFGGKSTQKFALTLSYETQGQPPAAGAPATNPRMLRGAQRAAARANGAAPPAEAAQ